MFYNLPRKFVFKIISINFLCFSEQVARHFSWCLWLWWVLPSHSPLPSYRYFSWCLWLWWDLTSPRFFMMFITMMGFTFSFFPPQIASHCWNCHRWNPEKYGIRWSNKSLALHSSNPLHCAAQILSTVRHKSWARWKDLRNLSWGWHSFQTLISYLIFVISFTQAKFLENKIYTENRQFFTLNR